MSPTPVPAGVTFSTGEVFSTLRVLAPGRADGIIEGEAAPCTWLGNDSGGVLSCPDGAPRVLRVRLSGYEEVTVPLDPPAGEGILDLRGIQWQPTPLPVVLEPEDLATDAVLVWHDARDVLLVDHDAGPARAGPRIPPGATAELLVVGRTVAAVSASLRRPIAGPDLIRITLGPGRSVAAVCRHPYSDTLLPDCHVAAEEISPFTQTLGYAVLVTRTAVSAPTGVAAMAMPESATLIRLDAEEFAPVFAPVGQDTVVVDLPLADPAKVEVRLLDGRRGHLLDGTIRVLAHLAGEEIAVTEAPCTPESPALLQLARGRYRLLGEAAGFHPGEFELTLDRPYRAVSLELMPGRLARGVVMSGDGRPVPNAAVVATSEGALVSSPLHIAMTDPEGAFTVTIPAGDQALLRVSAEGFASATALLPPGEADAEDITMVLRPECRVILLPTWEDGHTAMVPRLSLINWESLTPAAAEPAVQPGEYLALLSPGSWQVVAEADRAFGWIEVPSSCEGWRGAVTLNRPGPHPNP